MKNFRENWSRKRCGVETGKENESNEWIPKEREKASKHSAQKQRTVQNVKKTLHIPAYICL